MVARSNQRLRSENALLRTVADQPFLIRNFELNLLPYLRPLTASGTPLHVGKRIVLFGKDGCRFCTIQGPWWKRLIEAASHGLASEIWLVSLNQGREFETFAKEIAPVGLPVRRYSVTSVAAFTLGTGLKGVPTTLITSDDRVQLVHTGTWNEELLAEAVQVMSEPAISTKFLPPGQLELVRP